MRAIQYTRHGGPDVLHLDYAPIPEPGPNLIRVAVRAAGVNALDWKIREGRLGEHPMPYRPGLELAGVVDAVGDGVAATVGDEVLGWSLTGAYAEYALAEFVTTKPPTLTWHDAAALPVAGEAAVRALRDLKVAPGETLLIHGAGGNVGALATQLAIADGTTVIGTASAGNIDYVSSLGATPVIHGEGLADRVRQLTSRIDAVLDVANLGALPDLLTLHSGSARVLTLTDPAAPQRGIAFSSRTPSPRDTTTLAELATKAAASRLHIRHAHRYPLAKAADAQQDSASGHSPGKTTLTIE